MKNIKLSGYYLLLLLTIGFAFQSCSDDEDEQTEITPESVFENIRTNDDAELLYELDAQITGMEGIGVNPMEVLAGQVAIPNDGLRQNFDFGGSTTGILSGNLTGTDYLTVRPDGSLFIDAYGVLTTDDNAKIAVQVRGVSKPRPNSTIADITETISFATNHEKYAYLNNKYVLGVGTSDAATGGLNISAYGLDKDPFDGNNPYLEADKPDYANFPYTWENIQNNSNATLVYEFQSQITGAEGLGIDPNKVFMGQQPIPAEGLRMNVTFAGTLEGEINGTLEGIDYVTVQSNGNLDIDAFGLITTTDGEKIALEIDGLTIPSSTPGISNIFESGSLTSNSQKYGKYNDKYIVGVGISNAVESTLTIRLYSFDSNPF